MISDCVSLSDKLGRSERAFVAEQRALNARLSIGAVLGKSPNKDSVSVVGSQNDVLSWPDKLSLLWVSVVAGVVPSIECETGDIAVFRQIPMRLRMGFHLACVPDGSTVNAPTEACA